jgi:hypothetical protein
VLGVMLLDWYEVPTPTGEVGLNAWESFAVNDVILALAAAMALAAVVATATQPTAAMPLAIASLASLVTIIALVLVTIRVIWPPDLTEGLETGRMTGAWLGLVATTVLAGGCMASIRDERLPRPEHPAEPRLVQL